MLRGGTERCRGSGGAVEVEGGGEEERWGITKS